MFERINGIDDFSDPDVSTLVPDPSAVGDNLMVAVPVAFATGTLMVRFASREPSSEAADQASLCSTLILPFTKRCTAEGRRSVILSPSTLRWIVTETVSLAVGCGGTTVNLSTVALKSSLAETWKSSLISPSNTRCGGWGIVVDSLKAMRFLFTAR